MEHVFIVNPSAGSGNKYKKIMEEIQISAAEEKINYHIYVTQGRDRARQLVYDWCDRASSVRFYACGGDGTLQTVASAVVGRQNAQVGAIPIGTGNDFVRNFKNPCLFSNVKEQIQGIAHPIDVIKYKELDTGFCTYGVNMINIGFDSDAAVEMERIKRHPLFGGSRSYFFGVARVFLRKLGKQMEVTADGEGMTGEFLLAAIAGGRFCGGGFMAAPGAVLTDGLLDLHAIKKIGRTQFLSLVGKYRKGTYLKNPRGKKVTVSRQCREVKIVLDNPTNISVDGEIRQGKELLLKMQPQALQFSAPIACWSMANMKNKEEQNQKL
jgi:YegS/Rv2252/BmrU family lipid kinase